MILDNIRGLQNIIETSVDDIETIGQVIEAVKKSLNIDIVIADKRGKSLFNGDFNTNDYFYKIPLITNTGRIGMLYVNGIDKLNQNELAYFYSAIPIYTLILKNIIFKRESLLRRQIASARTVIASMTALEIEALKAVFSEISQEGGIIVIKKLAEKHNITRSLIVNALKKIEGVGIITTQSLGVKGTKVTVVNKYFITELK